MVPVVVAAIGAGLIAAGAIIDDLDNAEKEGHREGHEDGFRDGVKDTAEKAEKGQLK